MTNNDYLISVIVIAHDRKIFLPKALRSLEAQTLTKDKFEVIVVKYYEDNYIDSIINKNSWKNIVTLEKSLGGKVAIGVEESKGNIITILEDDDIYMPERLQIIYNAFLKYKSLIYFRNEYAYIDEAGNLLGNRENYYNYGDIVIPQSIKAKVAESFAGLTWASLFNSAMAISADLLKSRLQILKNLIFIDPLLFNISLIEKGDLMATSKILTLKGVNKLGSFHQLKGIYERYIQIFIHYLIDIATIKEKSYIDLGCKVCVDNFLLRTVETASLPNKYKYLNLIIPLNLLPSYLRAIHSKNPYMKLTILTDFLVQYMPNSLKLLYYYGKELKNSLAR
jgi:glycosyltransferase involved in cell wall biosynthesis